MSMSKIMISTSNFLILLSIILILIYYLIRLIKYSLSHYRLYCAVKSLPGPVIENPFIGHLGLFWKILRNNPIDQYGKKLNELMHDLCDKYADCEKNDSGLVRLWFGPFMPWIIVSDAKAINTILTHPDCLAKARYGEAFRLFAGEALFTMNGKKSVKERKKYLKFFKISSLDSYIPVLEQHLERFNRRIEFCIHERGGEFADMGRLVSDFIFDSIGENFACTQFNSQLEPPESKEPEILRIKHRLVEMMILIVLSPWTYFLQIPNSLFQILFFLPMTFMGLWPFVATKYFYWNLVGKRFSAVRKNIKIEKYDFQNNNIFNDSKFLEPEKQERLLDSIIESHLLNQPDRVENIEANISVFMLAGYDTSTTATSWIAYMLGHHTHAQEKCRTEVLEYLQELTSTSQPITAANLKQLKYLEACIKESLRLIAPAPSFGRKARAPVAINPQHTIPINTNLVLFIQRSQTNEKYFKNPKQFYPERFLNENCGENEIWCTNSAVLPFGGGQRSCIAKDYAIMQLKLFFVNLLRNYSFEAKDTFGDAKLLHTSLQSPAHFPVKFERRAFRQ